MKRIINAIIALNTISLCYAQVASKSLLDFKAEKLPFVKAVEVHGEKPTVIYVPIIHDGPMSHVSSTNYDRLHRIMSECEKIAAHLYKDYDVKNILLEGCGQSVANYYEKMKGTEKKISFKHTKMKVFEAWGNILNKNQWDMAYTTRKPVYGPLSVLGSEYDKRIKKALSTAHTNGWFQSFKNYKTNEKAFNLLIADAVAGYNDKRDAILKEDPKLKREYKMIVGDRNKDFIKNLTAKSGPGIMMVGSGHLHDLKKQMKEGGVSFMVVAPKSLEWPIAEKSEQQKYEDMLKQGCKLKECNLTFGDGRKLHIKIPVK